MPYTIVKVRGGYKVKNTETGEFHSKKPMTHNDAIAQLLILKRAEKKEK